MNNLKLSIIVLTHSGDDTLYQCLYSIKNQTFKKFKCIVIGYDTTDACQTIARTICKQDNRFSYIPITGKSLCYAKNLGISLACNDYTMILQDNNFLQQDCFEKAVFFIRKYNPQILWTASIQYTSDNYQSNINTHINGMYHIGDMPFASAERCYIYDKIYRTSLLKNIRFVDTEQEQVSNIMFNHDCLLQTNRVVNINYRLMHHYTVENECNINDESKTQLTQYIDKVNDDNVKKSIELIIQHEHRQLNYIEKEDTLIVSFTSWKKRIQYCKHVVDLMMKQTTLPDKIILNLSEEEFPNKYNDLPAELIQEETHNTLFEIYWVKENTTVWKKIIPTMNRFPQALVFSIDDDIEYPDNYISEMYNTYCENNKCYPVVAYEFMINDNLCHSGPFTLTSKKFYNDLLNKIYDELIYPTINERKWQSDIVYYKVTNALGYKYIKCENIDGNTLYRKSQINKENKYSTWDKEYKNERKENIDLINKYIKQQYDFLKCKKVIYTCITGNYDNLIEPGYVSPEFDYICFTDNNKLKSNIWKILPIPNELSHLSKVKQQRNIKINTHKYLKEYDLSIWVDSSVRLNDNINNILITLNFNKYDIFIPNHPERTCIYDEGNACIKLNKDKKEIIDKELLFFKHQKMPQNFGLYETNVIIKLHNSQSCIKLMELWCKYVNEYSHRDQISLPYCLWKLNYNKIYKLYNGFNHTSYFNWIGGLHKKINICIIHYNTPELTNALIKSINKNVKRAFIYLFDNSDKKPFTYEYNNMLYLDNTNGKYINFNKWLDNYPTRLQSKEHIGNYGSARHSISVQKCIELINDNFILMDSDILLKRDVSGFVNNKYIYVGETEKQGNGKYRILPFCLFINVKMCKKYNVPWFDANYMHGLHLTKEADKYDTGGAFYIHTRNYPHKNVTLKSFIVHYKGGSWEEKYMKEHNLTLTSKEWLKINKKYWE